MGPLIGYSGERTPSLSPALPLHTMRRWWCVHALSLSGSPSPYHAPLVVRARTLSPAAWPAGSHPALSAPLCSSLDFLVVCPSFPPCVRHPCARPTVSARPNSASVSVSFARCCRDCVGAIRGDGARATQWSETLKKWTKISLHAENDYYGNCIARIGSSYPKV